MTMKTLAVTEVARNFITVMNGAGVEQEEVVLMRHDRVIARLLPEQFRGALALSGFAPVRPGQT